VGALPVASVIVPAHNAAATLGGTLTALARQELDEEYEVIVVDDGSSDNTAAVAEAAELEVTLVRERGVGPGPARNAGVAVAQGEVLAFTDADCKPTPSWLAEGIAGIAGADLVQGAVHADPAAVIGPFDRTVWVTREHGLYECANLFCRRDAFERVGGFEDWLDARLGKPLAEDAWLGWRIRRAGMRTAFRDTALVHHAVFDRDGAAFVAERRRLVYFPAIARQMPEIRRTMFFARVFLSRRSAAFDAAVAGTALAAARRRRAPLLAAVPWLWMLARAALPWRRRAPGVAAAEAAADAVGFAALAAGSIRAKTPVL
jgi:glycosyltransferase involved in cell wall biosynthesis